MLYADYLLNKHIEKQFTPFRKGFYKVVAGGIISVALSLFRLLQQRSLVCSLTAKKKSISKNWKRLQPMREDTPKIPLSFGKN